MTTSVDFTTVCVTGANGYLASHIIEQLILEPTFIVKGTIRNKKHTHKYQHLIDFAKKNSAEQRLQIEQVDLEDRDAVAQVIKNCTIVMHTACPVPEFGKGEGLIEPMVKMTENILYGSLKSGTVKRFIYTSSGGAIYSPFDYDPEHKYSEKDRNTYASETNQQYYYGKIKCEDAIENFMKQHNHPFDFVILNPTFMLGPPLNIIKKVEDINMSVKKLYDIVKKMVDEHKQIKTPTPGFCDVRDVARVHVLAIKLEEAKNQKVLVSHPTGFTWDTIASKVKAEITKIKSDNEGVKKLQKKLKEIEKLEDEQSSDKLPIKFDTTQFQRLFPEPGLRLLNDTLLETVVWLAQHDLF